MMKQGRRNRRGQQLIEVVCGLLFLIPIFLFLFDISFMYLATNLSDGVARDAARAAAQVEPTTNATSGPVTLPLSASTNSFQRANAVITLAKSRTNANGYIRDFRIADDSRIQLVAPRNPGLPLGGVPDPRLGGPWVGTVRVKTTLTYVLPVAIPNVTPAQLETSAIAEFPITASRVGSVRGFVQ